MPLMKGETMYIGNKFRHDASKNIWIIERSDFQAGGFLMKMDNTQGMVATRWITRSELINNYTSVKKDDAQIDWFNLPDWSLPKGKENEKMDCHHSWKIYNGLNFSDEYCEKCKKVRPLEKK